MKLHFACDAKSFDIRLTNGWHLGKDLQGFNNFIFTSKLVLYQFVSVIFSYLNSVCKYCDREISC